MLVKTPTGSVEFIALISFFKFTSKFNELFRNIQLLQFVTVDTNFQFGITMLYENKLMANDSIYCTCVTDYLGIYSN